MVYQPAKCPETFLLLLLLWKLKKLIYHLLQTVHYKVHITAAKNNSILAQNNPQKGTKSSLHDQHFSQENLPSHAYNKSSPFICSCTFKHNFLFILHHTKTISTAPVIDNTQHIIQCNRKLLVFNKTPSNKIWTFQCHILFKKVIYSCSSFT